MPPPSEQSAANWATLSYTSDQLVCADPALLALDRRMVDLLTAALHGFEPQQVWFLRRSRCAYSERHAACLRAAYRERIRRLSALAGRASDQGRPALPAICDNAPWGNRPVRLHLGQQAPLIIEDGRGKVLVEVSALQPRDDWLPFVRFVIEDAGIRLEPREGIVVLCRALRSSHGPSP